MNQQVINEINDWLTKAQIAVEANTKKQHPDFEFMHKSLGWTIGPKMIRVFVAAKNTNKSAFCFIDLNGNIYKAAGWKGPAKGIRGHVTTIDPTKLDGHTDWLYIRR